MMWTLGAVGFVLALLWTIAIHELGHLVAAKKFGLHVPKYFVGFGKTLFSRTHNGTEYGVKAIPLGGYVLINDPKAKDPESDESLLLSNVAPWKRQIIFAAGPAVNIVVGTGIFLILLMNMGISAPTSYVEATTCEQTQVCAAEEAGMLAGDKIVAINDSPVGEQGIPTSVMEEELKESDTVQVTVLRNGENEVLDMTPVQVDGRWMIGIQMQTQERNLSLGESATVLTNIYKQNFQAILNIPGNVPVLLDIIAGGERPETAPSSVIGATKISGDVTASKSLTADDKWLSFISLVASFNIGIGLINLLPFLPLDGGRMLIAFIDSIKMRISTIRNIAYQPTGPKVVTVMTMIFGVLLLGYMGLVMLADIINPVVID